MRLGVGIRPTLKAAVAVWCSVVFSTTASISIGTAAVVHQEASPKPLFALAAPSSRAARAIEPNERSRRAIDVDLSVLGGFYGAGPASTRLDLSAISGKEMTATLDRLEPTASGRVWIGAIDKIPLSHVLLAIVRGRVVGTISWPGGNEYRIAPLPDENAHMLVEVEDTQLLVEGMTPMPIAASSSAASLPAGALAAVVDADPNMVDLLAVYNADVAKGLGSDAALAAAVDVAIWHTNVAFANSGLLVRLRLAGLRQLSFADPTQCTALLSGVVKPTDGVLDEVHALRDSVGADLVYVFFARPADCTGIAFLPPLGGNNSDSSNLGFGMTVLTSTGGNVLAHEVGHSFGAMHEWYLDDSRNSAKAHTNCAAGWVDKMAYGRECRDLGAGFTSIPFYSNPRLQYANEPLGVPAGTSFSCRAGSLMNPSCDADAVSTIAANTARVVQYRPSRFGVVQFPPRNELMDFRIQLEAKYRDGLQRSAADVSADPEGSVIWTAEYMRYRLSQCSHAVAVDKVTRQIRAQELPPVCGGAGLGAVGVPARDQTYAFRLDLERVYRDELRRAPTRSSVDPEGEVVWIQEYLRYRLSGCQHQQAAERAFVQIDGRPAPSVC